MLEVCVVLFVSLAGLICVRIWENAAESKLQEIQKWRNACAILDRHFPDAE